MTLAPPVELSARISQPDPSHRVARIIAAADFDDHQRDIATSGLCATFALALLEVARRNGAQAQAVVAYVGDPSLHPAKITWRHALIEADGRYFDIEGEVEPEHVIENYCWGRATDECGLLALDDARFQALINSTRNAFDAAWLTKWAAALSASPQQ